MSSLKDFSQYQRTLDQAAAEAGTAVFMWKIYRWMSVGLALTGLVAWLTSSSPTLIKLIFANPFVFYGLLIGELIMVVVFGRIVARVSAATAATMFLAYSAALVSALVSWLIHPEKKKYLWLLLGMALGLTLIKSEGFLVPIFLGISLFMCRATSEKYSKNKLWLVLALFLNNLRCCRRRD